MLIMNKLYMVLALSAPITFNAFSMDAEKAERKAAKQAVIEAWAAAKAQARQDFQNQTPNAVAIQSAANQRLQAINQHLVGLTTQYVKPLEAALLTATDELDTAIERLAIVAYFNNGAPRFGQRVAQRVNAILAAAPAPSEAQHAELSAFMDLIAIAKASSNDTDEPLQDYDALAAATNRIHDARGE